MSRPLEMEVTITDVIYSPVGEEQSLKALAKTRGGKVVEIPSRVYRHIGSQPRSGDRIFLNCERNDHGRGPDFKAHSIAFKTDQTWAHWQAGDKAEPLPDTILNEPMPSELAFCCWACGELIVTGQDIFRISASNIWTSHADIQSLEPFDKFWNKVKKCFEHRVRCIACHTGIGTLYEEPFDSGLAEQPYPAFKLIYALEQFDTVQSLLCLDAPSQREAQRILNALPALGPNPNYFRVRPNKRSYRKVHQQQRDNALARGFAPSAHAVYENLLQPDVAMPQPLPSFRSGFAPENLPEAHGRHMAFQDRQALPMSMEPDRRGAEHFAPTDLSFDQFDFERPQIHSRYHVDRGPQHSRRENRERQDWHEFEVDNDDVYDGAREDHQHHHRRRQPAPKNSHPAGDRREGCRDNSSHGQRHRSRRHYKRRPRDGPRHPRQNHAQQQRQQRQPPASSDRARSSRQPEQMRHSDMVPRRDSGVSKRRRKRNHRNRHQ